MSEINSERLGAKDKVFEVSYLDLIFEVSLFLQEAWKAIKIDQQCIATCIKPRMYVSMSK